MERHTHAHLLGLGLSPLASRQVTKMRNHCWHTLAEPSFLLLPVMIPIGWNHEPFPKFKTLTIPSPPPQIEFTHVILHHKSLFLSTDNTKWETYITHLRSLFTVKNQEETLFPAESVLGPYLGNHSSIEPFLQTIDPVCNTDWRLVHLEIEWAESSGKMVHSHHRLVDELHLR